MSIEDVLGGGSPKTPQLKRQGQVAFLDAFHSDRTMSPWLAWHSGAPQTGSAPPVPPCGPFCWSFADVCRGRQGAGHRPSMESSLGKTPQAGLASGSSGWGGEPLEMRVGCEGETQSPAFPSGSFRTFSPTFQGPPRRMLWKATLLSAILALSYLP